jgi:tRNA threonylcarbamoyladenosine biosynthesis protein TsaB
MRVLAIETSGQICGVAVADERGLAGAVEFRHQMSLSRRLLPAIDQLLALIETPLTDLEGVAVSLGPGSFTGLRVGVTTAKTLAWALSLPLAGVPTLEAVAAGATVPAGAAVCAVLPTGAAGDLPYYAAVYGFGPEGAEVIAAPAALAAEEVAALAERHAAPILIAGATARADFGRRQLSNERGTPAPSAATVARLGGERLTRGEVADRKALAPFYARPSTAEARRQACPGH